MHEALVFILFFALAMAFGFLTSPARSRFRREIFPMHEAFTFLRDFKITRLKRPGTRAVFEIRSAEGQIVETRSSQAAALTAAQRRQAELDRYRAAMAAR